MQALMTALDFMSDRKRKRKTYLLDPLVTEGIAKLAKLDGRSENQFVERLFFQIAKEKGVLDPDEELLGELRGGLKKPLQTDEITEDDD